MMVKSIFDAPPLKPSERKAYSKFAKKMNELGYTRRLVALMTETLLGNEIDKREWDDLMLRIKLEEIMNRQHKRAAHKREACGKAIGSLLDDQNH